MKKTYLVLLVGILITATASGQKLDLTFQAPLPIRAAYINAIVVQPDGKILLGGDIKFYGTQRVHNLIRIEADGSLDETFSFKGEDDMIISNLALLASGEMVAVSGKYDSYNDIPITAKGKLMKLNSDGVVSNQIELSVYPNYKVFAVDAADRILMTTDKLVRYNPDLTLDESFEDFNANGGVTAIALTGDKILVAGLFSSVKGVEKHDIVRLNSDGSLDPDFDTGQGTTDGIGSMMVQSDGKILLGNCYINSFNGVPGTGLLRLNANGSVDAGFNPPRVNGPVSAVIAAQDGVYVAAFLEYGGETSDRLFRLNPSNGERDIAFAPARLEDFGAISLRMAMSGDQVVLNNTQIEGNVFGVSKMRSDGTYDDTFHPEAGRYGTIKLADVHQDKLLVAGDFIRVNGIETYGIARLSLNGELDETFRLKENKGIVYQLKVLDGDNVLVTTYKNFFKLDSQGNERPEFAWAPFKFQYQVVKFRVLADGKIITADPNLIYRLNADGSEDVSFDIEDICCVRSTAFDFDVQGDNVIWGSAFSAVGSVSANRLVRLTTGADVDPSFDIGAGPDESVTLIKVLNNNEIIVGGFFDHFDERQVTLPLVKLSPDGKLDQTFYDNLEENPALPYDIVFSKKVEQLGSTIYFQHRNGIYALGTDGKVDTDFHIPAVVSAVTDIITLTDNPGNGRQKSGKGVMYTLGNFTLEGNASPSFLLKMEVDVTSAVPSDITTGVEQIIEPGKAFSLDIYPQPVQDRLRVSIGGRSGIYTMELFDMTGRRLLETTAHFDTSGHAPEFEIANAPAGVYLMKVTSEYGQYSFAKFVKSE
jgi:uncharacterized delta-60 repeat protein